jgi:hypothetical protein
MSCQSSLLSHHVLLQADWGPFISVVAAPASATKQLKRCGTPDRRRFHVAVGPLAMHARRLVSNARLSEAFFLQKLNGSPGFICTEVRTAVTARLRHCSQQLRWSWPLQAHLAIIAAGEATPFGRKVMEYLAKVSLTPLAAQRSCNVANPELACAGRGGPRGGAGRSARALQTTSRLSSVLMHWRFRYWLPEHSCRYK